MSHARFVPPVVVQGVLVKVSHARELLDCVPGCCVPGCRVSGCRVPGCCVRGCRVPGSGCCVVDAVCLDAAAATDATDAVLPLLPATALVPCLNAAAAAAAAAAGAPTWASAGAVVMATLLQPPSCSWGIHARGGAGGWVGWGGVGGRMV